MSVVSYCDSGGDFAGGCNVNESNLTETGTSPSVVICKEVFDENYQPSTDEVRDYAIKIGIDPVKEGHLIYLARDGLMQALPNDWQPCYNEKYESYYYYNRRTKVTQWDHPLDAEYRLIVEKKRRELFNLQLDIISSDDLSQIDSGIKSLQCNDDLTELTATPTQLSSTTTGSSLHNNIIDINIGINNLNGSIPLNGRIMTTFGNKMLNNDKKLLEPLIGHKFEVIKVPMDENKIPIKIDLNMKNNRIKYNNADEEDNLDDLASGGVGSGGGSGYNKINNKEIKGFTLTGQGAMFLKSNKNLFSNNSSKPIDIINKTTTKLNDNNICTSPTVKGILRDSSLTDIRYRNNNNNNNSNNNNILNNIINSNTGDDIDDKKSVRFNLNNKYDLSTEEDNSDEDQEQERSPLDEQQQELVNKIKEKRLLYQKSEGTFMHSKKHFNDKNVTGIEQVNDIDSNEESDDDENDDDISSKENDDNIIDDAWDFMQDDDNGDCGDDDDDDQVAVGHVKDVTIIPNKQRLTNKLGKTLSNDLTITNTPTESSEETVKKPLKLFNKADGNLMMLTKNDLLTKQNLIKPLYHDSDSCDSQIDIIKNLPNDNQQTKQNEISENLLRQQMEIRLNEYRKKLIDNENAEINKLKEKSKELLEKLIIKEKENYENDMKNKLNDEKLYYENQLKIELKKLEENYEKIIKENEETIKLDASKNVQQLNDDEVKKMNLLKRELDEKYEKEFNEYKIKLKTEFDDKRNEIINEHKKSVDILQRNHTEILQELERDLKTEEELLRKEHTTNLSHLKDKLTHEMDLERQRMRDTGEDRLYEKIRCEKRLLEDKYRCLKEKYIRLKTDVKLSLERRNNRRREQQLQQQSLTGSETERSNSNKHGMIMDHGKPPATPKHHIRGRDAHQIQSSSLNSSIIRDKSPLPPAIQTNTAGNNGNNATANSSNLSKDKKFGAAAKYIKHLQQHYQGDDTTSISQSDTTISNNCNRNRYNVQEDNDNSDNSEVLCNNQYNNNLNNNNVTTNNNNNNLINNNNIKDTPGRQRRKIFSRMKSASTSRLNSTNNPKVNEIGRPCTPVENLRRQLQKLEDLEDQFPDNTLDTTYHLRYPFSDVVNNYQSGTSSELEFFKHRIHLERDSVRRAKESLRTQRSNFRARQREIKQRHKTVGRSHTLDQLIHEEKELTEMEVNLHRTRALLGEKVIRLRHLEQSLQRIYDKEKPFLSDFLTSTGIDDNRGRVLNLLGTEQIHKDDATLSDLSSHSSSGFSSTDFGGHTDTNHVVRNKEMYQESSEIIQSLENLNAEIREIWDILSKQQAHGIPPPPPPSILYTASATAIAAGIGNGGTGSGNGQTETIGWPVTSNTMQQHQAAATTTAAQQQTTQQMTSSGLLAHHNQHHQQTVIPTLADRLETYRQMAAAGRTTTNPTLATLIGGGSGNNGVGLSNIVTTSTVGIGGPVNMIVSQSPLAAHYTTSLVERTRDLRNWLRQAKNEHEQIFGVVGGVGGVGGVSGGISGMGGTTNNPGNNISINGGSKIVSSTTNNGQQGAQL